MEYRQLLNIHKKASRIVYGAGNHIISGDDSDKAIECLDAAYESGFTVFDTAHIYGNSEKNLGLWLEKRNLYKDVILMDKGCNPGMIGSKEVMSPKLIREQVNMSLERLRTDYIDLYVLHRDDKEKEVGPIIEVLNELKEAGKIGIFGASNWTLDRFIEANEYATKHNLEGFSVSSPCYNMIELKKDPWGGSVHICGEHGKPYRKYLNEHKIPIICYSSLARGYLSGKYVTTGKSIEESLPSAPIQEYHHPDNVAILSRIEAIAKEHGCLVSQIALAWLISQDMVYPITSPSSKKHMEDTIKSFEFLDLFNSY